MTPNDQTPEANAKELEAGLRYDWKVGDMAERIEDHPLVKAGEVHEVVRMYRGGYLGFAAPVGGEWSPSGWRTPAPAGLGHTDLMISPEAIDEFLATGDHPEITAPAALESSSSSELTARLSKLNEFHRTDCRYNHWSATIREQGCDCGLTSAIIAALHPSSAADAKPVAACMAWRFEEQTMGVWMPRLTFDKPEPGPRIRNVVAMADAQPHPSQNGVNTSDSLAKRIHGIMTDHISIADGTISEDDGWTAAEEIAAMIVAQPQPSQQVGYGWNYDLSAIPPSITVLFKADDGDGCERVWLKDCPDGPDPEAIAWAHLPGVTSQQAGAEGGLAASLREVMSWIDNWEPSFVEDDEWAETKSRALAALKLVEG